MLSRSLVFCVLSVLALSAATKKPATGRAGNENVEINATALTDREAIKQELGSDLGGYYVVVQMTVTPKASQPLGVHRDDFLLRTDRDGEKSTAYAPSQIAGRGVLVVSQGAGGGGIMGDSAGPTWGGYPGTMDRPRRMGGDGGGIGNAGESSTQATVSSGAREKEDPLLAVLKQKGLPEKETSEPVSGLLYFPLEAKQKTKDLELIYTAPEGKKLSVRFR